MAHNVMTSSCLNSFDQNGIEEYGNSIRRHFLNDMVIAYERYSMFMIASHNNGQLRIDPALVNDRQLGAHLLEQRVSFVGNHHVIPSGLNGTSKATGFKESIMEHPTTFYW